MKNQALFSSKDKSKKLKCGLLQFLFGALRDNICTTLCNQFFFSFFFFHANYCLPISTTV